MTPKVELHNADALEVLRGMPDNAVDAVITDPPYGVDLPYDGYADTFAAWKELVSRFIPEACRVSRDAVIVPTSKIEGEAYLYANHPPLWRVCWFKGASDTRCPIGWKDWEVAFVYGKKKTARAHDHFYAGASGVRKEVTGHPCPKPLAWARWFVERFSKAGQVVLDPFMGSGTVGVACVETGRHFVGVELSPEYFALSQTRIGSAQPSLIPA